MKQYLVIAELEYDGYVIGTTSNLQEAEDKLSEIFMLADLHPFNELYKLNDYLKSFQSYTINGNGEYFGKFKTCRSNGSLSVYIMEISESFSLQQFISERENTSYAVTSEVDMIPEILFYAN